MRYLRIWAVETATDRGVTGPGSAVDPQRDAGQGFPGAVRRSAPVSGFAE